MPARFGLSISPHGALRLDPGAFDAAALDDASASRIQRAFARGTGYGVLELGAVEVATALAPSLGWARELGRRFMTAVCGLPDLEELRERASVPVPESELQSWILAAPPLTGGEYATAELAIALWSDIERAFQRALSEHRGSVQEWLRAQNPIWNRVGRLVLHLAENKRDTAAPFAFLATYTARLSRQGSVQHVPLGRALEEASSKKDRGALLSLLEPLHRASEKSSFLKELVDAGEVFHPLAWTTDRAFAFLQEIPVFEAAGLVVRVPDWWTRRRPLRPQVTVRIGKRPPSELGFDALLDFSVELTLDGQRLTGKEWAEITKATTGLAQIREKWVEVDREKLEQALAHWQRAERAAAEGVGFHEAMRLIAGLGSGDTSSADAPSAPGWFAVEAGDWLSSALEGLRSPEGLDAARPGPEFRATLRPYQEVGVRWLFWLASLRLGGCLADDMGLGKTVQVIALLLARRNRGLPGRSLLVVPASLIGNWRSEFERFAPALGVSVAHQSEQSEQSEQSQSSGQPPELDPSGVVITSYGCVARYDWLRAEEWALVVLDEAQAIKNPAARQTRAVKELRSSSRLALTGTPIENRLSDLWSLFDFLCPGLLGSAKDFSAFAKRLERGERPDYSPLRNLLKPYILRRLKTDKSVISDLPDKTELSTFCSLTKQQAALYHQAVEELARDLKKADGIKRRGLVLAALLRLKQICNHPSHWLRDGEWDEAASGKFVRLRELCEPIAARQEKVIVFTQFKEATRPLAGFLAGVFGRPGAVLHGETRVARRAEIVREFQQDDGPPFFVLSLKAGGSGLNLTAASHVVHFDRWWNPAVENQATDRAFRIGQRKNVLVHKFVCRGTVEERIDRLIESKKELAGEILKSGAETAITELPAEEILRLVTLDVRSALAET
jgi:superfamily II DNA or RNA helicase